MTVVINGTTGISTPGLSNSSTTTNTGNVTNSGTVTNASTISVGNATPSASGAGITFPATQSASTDANTLDDYEEGTWTPALKFGGNSTGMVTNVAVASYTKVGRVVHVQFRFSYSTKGSSTGSAQIAGLPFAGTGNSVNQGYSAGSYTFESNGATTALGGLFGLAWEDSTIYLRANTGSSSSFTQLTDANFGTTSEVWGSVVYRTAA